MKSIKNKTTKLTKKYRLVLLDGEIIIFGEQDGITYTNHECYESDNIKDLRQKIAELGLHPDENFEQDVKPKNNKRLVDLRQIKVDLKYLNKNTLALANSYKVLKNRPDNIDLFFADNKLKTNEHEKVLALLLNDVYEYNCIVK